MGHCLRDLSPNPCAAIRAIHLEANAVDDFARRSAGAELKLGAADLDR